MIPLYELGGNAWTVLGFPMSQNRIANVTWSYAFEKYPPQNVIEIGTNNGGFTILLGVHAWLIGARIETFDLQESPTNEFRALSNILPIRFHRSDCFESELLIRDLVLQAGVTYLLCDGGDKQKEFNLFSRFLKSGDVVGAHDYYTDHQWWGWNEITKESVADSVKENNLEPFMQEHFDCAGWLVYRKR